MATLEWSDALVLHVAPMDATHQEFVTLLADVETAPDAQLSARWQVLLAHTEAHFAQEDHWMEATGFAANNCHATQHQVVLEVMREAAPHVEAGDYRMVRGMTPELATWFSQHAQTMDAALAQHMDRVGFDVETGALRHAEAVPSELISGCGGACAEGADPVPQPHATAYTRAHAPAADARASAAV